MSKSFPYPSENPHPKRIDHRLDLRICQHFINACLLHIQNLSTDRQDRLIHPVTRRLCGSPAESPSTIKISHFDASRLSQFASFPLLSNEYFCFVSRFVLHVLLSCGSSPLSLHSRYLLQRLKISVKVANQSLPRSPFP